MVMTSREGVKKGDGRPDNCISQLVRVTLSGVGFKNGDGGGGCSDGKAVENGKGFDFQQYFSTYV